MITRGNEARRLLIVLTCAVAVALAGPATAFGGGKAARALAPATAAAADIRSATDASTSTPGAARTAPFTLDLSRPGDFVAQKNFVQCVGASMQMMLNMIGPTDDTSVATQSRLQTLARSLSGQWPDGLERKGASVRGWTAGLNQLGAGIYRTVGKADLQGTLKMAATAMRETNRPVGLLVWRGRHAWVMAGFTATADPRLTSDFEVTEVIILDPLYPYGSRTWGPSPKPRQALSLAELGLQFVPRGVRGGAPSPSTSPETGSGGAGVSGTNDLDVKSSWSTALAGKFVIVMPVTMVPVARSAHALR